MKHGVRGRRWSSRMPRMRFVSRVCDQEFQNDLRYSKSVASESSSEKNGIPDNYSDDAENT